MVNDDFVKSVKVAKKSRTKTELRAFLGLAS